MYALNISNFQGDQKTVQDIESPWYQVVVCLSCLPRDQDISLRYQKVRDTKYLRYPESTTTLSKFWTLRRMVEESIRNKAVPNTK